MQVGCCSRDTSPSCSPPRIPGSSWCPSTTLTPADLRRLYGEKAPFCVFSSPPCKSSSKLVTDAQAQTPKYKAMTRLAIIETQLVLDAWAGDEPPFLMFENVPTVPPLAQANAVRVLAVTSGERIAVR